MLVSGYYLVAFHWRRRQWSDDLLLVDLRCQYILYTSGQTGNSSNIVKIHIFLSTFHKDLESKFQVKQKRRQTTLWWSCDFSIRQCGSDSSFRNICSLKGRPGRRAWRQWCCKPSKLNDPNLGGLWKVWVYYIYFLSLNLAILYAFICGMTFILSYIV